MASEKRSPKSNLMATTQVSTNEANPGAGSLYLGQGGNHWGLPSGLLQAIADLGPERTLDLSVTGLMSQLYHLNIEQKSQLNSALQRYPEASGLKLIERQIARSLALIERGLGVYQVDPKQDQAPLTFGGSSAATLSPTQLAELRQLGNLVGGQSSNQALNQLETPPPVPLDIGQGESAPTALVNLVKQPMTLTKTSADSLSVDIDQPWILHWSLRSQIWPAPKI